MKGNNINFVVHRQDWKDYVSWYIMESNGMGMIRITLESGRFFELSDLYVDEKGRDQGLGKELLHRAIGICKEHSQERGQITITTNHFSAPFCDEWYQKEGFKFDHLECPIDFDENAKKIEDNRSRVYAMEV